MSKVKKYSRQLMLLLLVIATAFTCFIAFSPEADAGATKYKWRVTHTLGQGNQHTEGCYIRLYYKTNNGTGTESYIELEGDTDAFDKDKNGNYYWISDSSVSVPSGGKRTTTNTGLPANAFPTRVYTYVFCEDPGTGSYQDFKWSSKLEVLDQSGNVIATASSGEKVITSASDDKSATSDVQISTANYPYVADWGITGTYPVYINRDGSSVSQSVSITAVDNYGVDWVNAPSLSTTNITLSSSSTSTPTLTFTNLAADYVGTIKATWSTGNTSKSSVSFEGSTDVYVAHTLELNANGGTYTGTNPITGKYTGETAEITGTPTRPAYTFTEWTHSGGNGSYSNGVFTFGTNSATLKANWTPVGYTITPVYDGMTYTPVNYNIESTSISLPTPSKTGYNFAGWVVSAADGNWAVGDSVTSNPSGKYGNITVTPTWTAKTYTLNFNLNAADAQCDTTSKTITFNAAYGTLPVPTRTAYSFAGWSSARYDGTTVTADTVHTFAADTTVYAMWTPEVYTITFNGDGGTTPDAIEYTVEDTYVNLPAAEKSGYTFSHWVVESQQGNWAAGTQVNGQLSSNYGNVVLKAVYTPNTYTLSFDLNRPAGAVTDPSCDSSEKTVTFDAAVGTLPVPTLDGYEFAGWYTEAAGGTKVTADTLYTTAGNSSVYATWTPVTYNIITDANSGDEVADGTYTIENGTAPAGGTKEGYTFSHWEVAADAGNWVAGETFAADADVSGKYGDVTFKAIWTPNKYTVTFNLNDTTGVGAATADKTQIQASYQLALNANEALPVATRNGYSFEGWFTAAEGGEKIDESTVYTTLGTSTYYAHWSLVEYTVSFNSNGGADIDPITYTVEDSLTLPVADKHGYTFTSWFYNGVTTGSWVRNTSYNADALALGTGNWGDVTLKANFAVKSYDITWVINGKTEVTSHPFNTVPTRDDPVVEDDPYYSYEFIGWDPVISIVEGEATYTAKFNVTPKQYTVTWVADDITIASQNVEYGAQIPAAPVQVPEKTGHTGEWDYTGLSTMPAENVTINAVYTPINYTVKWEINGIVVKTDSVPYGSTPSYSGAVPSKAENAMYRYTFKGWSPEVKAVDGDIKYVAEFDAIAKEYTVTWVADDVTVAEHTVAYGSRITEIPTVPAKLGMVGSWTGIPETMPAENITITAVYVDGCLVTWYLDGTSTGASYQLGFEKGEQIAYDRNDPTRPDDAEYSYSFIGWSETENGELISGYPVAGEEDFTYYAVYAKTPKEYTITWKADNNEVYSEVVAFGSDIENIPEIPAKTGHTGKWVGVPLTMPSTDVLVEAVYTPIDYTITWVIGENTYETTFAYGTMPSCSYSTDKASTATTDYTFSGWDKTVSVVSGDETYTAVYAESARKYTVTWEFEDGSVIASYKVANGDAITNIPMIADKTGHTAVYTVPAVMPTEDIKITVTYEANTYKITWVTPDGSVTEDWKYGTTPVYSGETPVKASTPEQDFVFKGWSPAVTSVAGDTTYTAEFTATNRKYSVIWYVNGEFFDARDVAFGDAIPNLEVPEKTGFTGIWDIAFSTMPAQNVTINAVYTAKKYTVYWKVDGLTVFSASVSYGSSIPAKDVPVKPGQTGTWVDVPETMPAENITINAEYTPNDYNVTWRVDGVESNATATYGVDFTVEFNSATIPEEVRVTVGGNALDSDYYTYNPATGKLVIKGTAIVGDVYITARAAGGKFNLILNVSHATLSNKNLVIPEKSAYHTTITPDLGYVLPDYIEIFVDGVPVTSGYTYDKSTGKLTINAEIITGEVEIAFDCLLDPDFDFTIKDEDRPSPDECDCGCHSDNAFTRFFFKLATFFRKLFSMTEYRYCDCGNSHW